ncbi:hypothetical protein GCM10009830_32970 [Glycomyces endophyticus]|uniref:Secreted protein n=1 Tax=Glycomyces endophyticus TaxID=480996 RepID=A0ABP4T6J6_9ACTN
MPLALLVPSAPAPMLRLVPRAWAEKDGSSVFSAAAIVIDMALPAITTAAAARTAPIRSLVVLRIRSSPLVRVTLRHLNESKARAFRESMVSMQPIA